MNVELDGHRDEPTELNIPPQTTRWRMTHWWESRVAHMRHRFARAVAWAAIRAWQITADWRAVRPIISRASAHLAILTLAAAAILFSGLHLPSRESQASATRSEATVSVSPETRTKGTAKIAAIAPKAATGTTTLTQPAVNNHHADSDATIVRVVQPHTEIPDRPRLEVITHTVQPGESVQSIAESYKLEPTTLLWSNPELEELPDLLRIGQQVIILPLNGAYHTVAEGDTLESIAEKYKVDVEAISSLPLNNLRLPLFRIQEGMKLIVPGGVKPYVPRRVTSYTGPVPTDARGTGAFAWPVRGSITQWYWWGHRAIDIAAPTGSAVLATDGGYVSFVGWTDIGYGYLIIIDHANAYATYYAHLSQMYVAAGQRVERGQVIGAVGSTGNSSGPHLHLEIRYNGLEQNPMVYLP